jgi:hypothetical protein
MASSGMIDRQARNMMADAIRSYMDEKTTAFQFDDSLARITSEEQSVRTIRFWLWCHYDDVKDHKIVASREEWDYFNRLLLLLASDAEIEVAKTGRRWHVSQAVAAVCVACFAYVVVRTGWGGSLFAWACPFGVVSMVLGWFNSRRRRNAIAATDIALTPFPSASSLLAVRRSISGFPKTRYPEAIADRRIRGPIVARVMWIPWVAVWLIFAPLFLLVQMLPERGLEIRINMPEA